MAFDKTNLQRVGGGVPGLYVYTTTADAIAGIIASGYFNDASDWLKQNDVIIAVDVGASVDVLVVTSADGASTVTTVNGT